ncbi:DoxX family protein [Pontibacter sp. G13]|uniref:DoxX family protein n=1 Tax=Pontibacter sp. G13 TaxID=3074898 RepID=UPI00288BF92C|nr:DoxX family protein [Pontibacter sp. G13]WNJ19800.1 DoxX family protein [Pontibacter sp. G13]
MQELDWSLDLGMMILFYASAGLAHFLMPKFFLKIIPPYIPMPNLVNGLVGLVEMTLALGLAFSTTRTAAAIGVVCLLLAVFPANVYHLTSGGAGMNIPKWLLWIRLPLQGLLIFWAWQYV